MKYFGKKQITILTLLIVLAVIPATLFLTQQKTHENSKAAASTSLSLVPETTASSPMQVKVGDTVSFDVMIDPGANLPSFVKLILQYNPAEFQASSTPFAVNSSAFSDTVEGPIVQNGTIAIEVTIGSDPSKAIQTVTKVGTVTLTAISQTTTKPSVISFGSDTTIYSVAKTDGAGENVLSTTTPAYITINPGSGITITPAPTTSLAPTQPPTPIPTEIPQPTPTMAPNTTYLTFTTFLHEIGNSGDNANPNASSLSNKMPIRPQRNVTAYVYNAQNQLTATQNGMITYNPADGNFSGNVDFNNSIPDGYYTVLLKEDTHLRKSVSGITHIVPLQDNTLPPITLVAGDINNDNTINILDYNILIGCYTDLLPPTNCSDTNKVISDMNDDGFVNQSDYNFFLREITVQNGN